MLTYQVRERGFVFDKERSINWPSSVEIRFHFIPLHPFGMAPEGGRTAVVGSKNWVNFNGNNGSHWVKSLPPLNPLNAVLESFDETIKLSGNVLSLSKKITSIQELKDLIHSLYFTLPMLLNIEFADPPLIEMVEGEIGSTKFRWELKHWNINIKKVTQEEQDSALYDSWMNLGIINSPERVRLVAALHYFHVACRLSRRAEIAGEFLSEVLLNLSKMLEVLFPSQNSGKTMEAARTWLRQIGYSSTEIESNFIPAMALRNKIDVGHVDLSLFTQKQLTVLHSYAERSEDHFRELLQRVLDKVHKQKFDVPAYTNRTPRNEVLKIIEKIEASMSIDHSADHNRTIRINERENWRTGEDSNSRPLDS